MWRNPVACLIMEIVMLICGIVTQFTGKFTVTRGRAVYGWPARCLGIVIMLPLPLSFVVGMLYGLALATQGKQFDAQPMQKILWVEPAIAIGILVIAMVSGFSLSNDPRFSQPRRNRIDDDDYDRERVGNKDDLDEEDEFLDRPRRGP
jgi:hypothetical protein